MSSVSSRILYLFSKSRKRDKLFGKCKKQGFFIDCVVSGLAKKAEKLI